MKSIAANLKAHLQGGLTTLATCWILTRKDGLVMRFTDHDTDIVVPASIPEAAGTYAARTGYTASSIASNSDLSVDQLDVYGVFDSASITDVDIAAGLYDGAQVQIFQCDYTNPGNGILKLRRGWLGEVTSADGRYTAELRGMLQVLQQTIGRTYLSPCDASVGSGRCKVRLQPPTWAANTSYTVRAAYSAETGSVVSPSTANGRQFKCTKAGTSGTTEPVWNTTIGGTTSDGTVTWTTIRALTVTGAVASTTARNAFTDPSVDAPDDWFGGGLLTWTSGLNSGRSMEVYSFASGGSFVLVQPMANNITVGDTYKVTAGCRKRQDVDCRDKFDNVVNFRGFPDVPGADQVNKFGGQ